MLPASLMPAFEGVFPLTWITVSRQGIPNITNLSKVWVIDEAHIAVANQMLRKSAENLGENPRALLCLVNPSDLMHWEVEIRFIRTESEGELFDQMKDDLQTVSWMAGEPDPFPLRSVLVFEVVSVRACTEESNHTSSRAEQFGELLQAASEVFEWNRTSYWMREDGNGNEALQLAASRGVPGAGSGASDLEPMRRLASLVEAKQCVVRLQNIRSQLRYLHTIRTEADKLTGEQLQPAYPREHELKTSFLGIPLFASGHMIGVICCEAMTGEAEMFDRFDNDFLEKLSRRLGEAIELAEGLQTGEFYALFRQWMERLSLEWTKSKDPFHTVLSARERQVAICAAKGWTNAEIAQSLFISKRTVTTHLERIFQKLELSSRAALTRYVIENNLHADADHDIPQ